jgi:hypothetical protein
MKVKMPHFAGLLTYVLILTWPRTFLFAGVFALTATVSRGDTEIVIAIRYLQPKARVILTFISIVKTKVVATADQRQFRTR